MPAAAICHLLRVASVHHVLVTFSTLSALAGEILDTLAEEGHALKISELPTLGEVYSHFRSSGTDSDSDSTETLPEVPTFSNRVEVYLHSSGSTGMPKAIPYSHEFMCKMQYQGMRFLGWMLHVSRDHSDTYFSCPDNIGIDAFLLPTPVLL
jgi:acyl-coenzyme A synthetase/AMP-(fatty) acid ligase